MKLVSWNVNGIRACLNKGFMESIESLNADIICLQETKAQEDQVDVRLDYYQYWNSAVKKGYSGTVVFTKEKPLSFVKGIDIEHHDQEGRVITLEYDNFYLVNVYTPNSQRELVRLDYRMEWEDDFRAYLLGLNKKKPVILCGDLNVAHTEIDIANPKTNTKNAGFTIEERNKFSELLDSGFVDTYRYLNPDKLAAYTWWSYMRKARERNVGWRIDYFCISSSIKDKIEDAQIYQEIMGSDHCPISLTINI